MSSLKAADYRDILSFLSGVGRVPDAKAFRETALIGLSRLIPSDQIGYNEVDFRSGAAIVVDFPEPFVWEGVEEMLAQYAHEHPVIMHYKTTGDLRALMVSDFLSRKEFHRTAIYNEIYSKLGAQDQIAIGLPGPPWMSIGIAFNRTKNFTERDREILDAVRPHLMHSYQNAIDRSWLMNAIDLVTATYPRGIVLLDFDGSVAMMTNKARLALTDFFGEAGSRLPGELEAWLTRRRSLRPADLESDPMFRKKVGDRTFRVRYLPSGFLDKPEMLTIDVHPREIDMGSLRRLGLTNRQIEVLQAVSRGLSNRQIADEMDVTPATVKKHLEEIYDRLGVSSRAEAVAVAFDAHWDL